MQIALDAAKKARGTTSFTAWVGAAVVREGHVVSVGQTQPAGGAHAEAMAMSRVDAHGADLYTVLEPCLPFVGKRNRPCTDLIIQAGIRRVSIALLDPDPNVSGRGSSLLREAGIAVEIGDGAEAATELLRPYLKQRQTGLPYVIAKFAASLDGRTATASGDSKWITGEAAREIAHQQRSLADAVMVGSGTVLADDPALTARPGGEFAPRQPIRVVVDARGRVPPGARLIGEPGQTFVATSYDAPGAWKREMAAGGATVIECEPAPHGVNLDQLLAALGKRGIISIWAEGGGTLLGSLFEGDHVDEVWAFIAPVIIGSDGLPAVGVRSPRTVAEALRLREAVIEPLPPDVLIRGYTGNWQPGR
jgi:diaminohydroxyphosphoribosylaminopyrimidine deaminase/5-amino-6-(5-phosphoribosylamino)uracil reductase